LRVQAFSVVHSLLVAQQDKLLERILHGASDVNIGFEELCQLLRRLARMIHERFCCNHGFAAATSLHEFNGVQAGGLAACPLDVLFQVRLGFSRLRTPVSQRDCVISQRTVMNNVGWDSMSVRAAVTTSLGSRACKS
jgi:hypothetical protein